MIYFVSADTRLFNSNNIQQVSIEESLEILAPLTIVGLDTETSGLSAWSDNLLLVQLGCRDFQVVIDCRTIDITLYKDYLESDRLFILWNAKFDLQWFYKYGIIIKQVYDGFLAEKLIWLGYPSGMHGLSLKDASKNYIGVELDKSVRGKIIWSKTLSDEIIIYGAEDVAHLEDIINKQKEEIDRQELSTAVDIENRFVRVLAYIEWCGVKIDENKWALKIKNDRKNLQKAQELCNQWLIENLPDSKYIYYDLQGDLFAENPFDTSPKVSLNWDSPSQMVKLFKSLGVNVLDKDGKESTDSKILKPQSSKCSLIPLFIDYKEKGQVCKAFGEKFLKQINPVSHRLHANWHSIGTDTGRVSCGEGGEDSINLLNLPAEAITRACFVVEEGNRWISTDYSGQESAILASIANDPLMLHELNEGNGDIHSLVASLMFDELRDVPLKDIKKNFKRLRQEAKGYEFLIAYGGDFNTMMSNFGLTKDDAKTKYDRYMRGLTGVQKYQAFCRKDWFNKGYITLSPLTKYRAHIFDYDLLMKLNNILTPEFYSEAKQYKGLQDKMERPQQREISEKLVSGKYSKEDLISIYGIANYYRQPISFFWGRKADLEKQSINYRIQHAGAACAKIAMVNFFNWICDNGLFGVVKITIIPYDEINCEAPNEIAEQVANQLYTEMIDSGKIFCTRCKLDADMSREEDGSLPDHWVH